MMVLMIPIGNIVMGLQFKLQDVCLQSISNLQFDDDDKRLLTFRVPKFLLLLD